MDSATFITQLRTLGLWPEQEPQQRHVLELSQRLPDGRVLARELIQHDLLTPYQANLLLTGKGQQLVVGPYRILQRLGEGGMGQVFKARHCRVGRIDAVKIIRPERVTNATALQRFLREAASAAKLAHPNIVRAYDADQFGELYYFAMQYVPGTDLSRLVKQRGPLPISQACHFIYQAAQGLQHIHDAGLVHRDVKPSNLMIGAAESVTPANVVKILDLGLARLLDDEAPAAEGGRAVLTKLGTVLGTADYLAPEQARDSRLADARSDVYSLGCTLYFALAGRPPFPGGSAIEKMMHHQLDEPEPVEQVRPEVPAALAQVVRRMMARKPEQRYPQAGAAAADLLPLFIDAAPAPPVPVAEADAQAPSEFAFDLDTPPEARSKVRPQLWQPATWGNWLWVVVAGLGTMAVLLLGLVVLLIRALSR